MATRRRLVGVVGTAVITGLSALAASAVVVSPVQARTTSSPQVRVASYNTASFVDHGRAAADVARLASEADIIGLQEMSSLKRRNAVKARLLDCSSCPFEGYMPAEPVMGGTPILYRWSRFRLEDSGTVQVSDATYVGAEGAGPSTLRAKYLNWVKLRERATGRTIYVVNNHAVPSVQGKDGLPNQKMGERLELYRKHMEGLTALIRQFRADGSLVVVTGDLNVNFRPDRRDRHPLFPYSRLGGVGVKASYAFLGEPTLGTHGSGGRLIDYVAASNPKKLQARSQRILTGYSSDHRPVVVNYRLS